MEFLNEHIFVAEFGQVASNIQCPVFLQHVPVRTNFPLSNNKGLN